MKKSLYINYDSLNKAKKELGIKIAIIARPDWFLKNNAFNHIIIETKFGIHNRCYLSTYKNIPFLIIYGRFDRLRTTSLDIDFELNQEVISMLEIKKIIGTFVVGSIKDNDKAGSIYIPHDFVGMGGYNQSRNKYTGFRNVDMFKPFCEKMRSILITGVKKVPFQINKKGIYVCFHGYPRIETEAELDFYRNNGWDIVGQTLDPEATLAREAGCHYTAIAATIDDRNLRSLFLANDPTGRQEIDINIIEGRKKTFNLFLESLPELIKFKSDQCNCVQQKDHVNKISKNFYYMPDFLND